MAKGMNNSNDIRQNAVANQTWINRGRANEALTNSAANTAAREAGIASYTVATLPATPTLGDRAIVTDATTPTYLGALTGGGAVVVPVFYDGTAWVSA